MSNEDLVCLGVITGAHGIKGEVKVKSFTEIPSDIAGYGELTDKTGSKVFSLKVTGKIKDDLRVKVKGIDDRNAAEAIRGTELYIPRSILPELDEEEFYFSDLIGLDVKDEDLNVIGKVNGVYNFGAGDIIEVNIAGKLEMLPFTKQYVPDISIKNGYIIVKELVPSSDEEEEDEG